MLEESVLTTVAAINLSVTGTSPTTVSPGGGGGGGGDAGEEEPTPEAPGDPLVPFNQALGLATQNIAQSAALAVSDGVDMMRNVETIMTTAMGVAMAQWIANPANVLYQQIITEASTQIANAAANFTLIATAAQGALNDFKPTSS